MTMYTFDDLTNALTSEQRGNFKANLKEAWPDPLVQQYHKDVSLAECLAGAFVWSSTPEGATYWMEIHDELYRKETQQHINLPIKDAHAAILRAKQLLEDLTVPTSTPKVSKEVRERAKDALKGFPDTSALFEMFECYVEQQYGLGDK